MSRSKKRESTPKKAPTDDQGKPAKGTERDSRIVDITDELEEGTAFLFVGYPRPKSEEKEG